MLHACTCFNACCGYLFPFACHSTIWFAVYQLPTLLPVLQVTRTLQDDNTLPRTLRNLEAVLQSGQVGYRKASWNQEFGYDVQLTQQRRSGEYTCIVSIHIRVFKPGAYLRWICWYSLTCWMLV